MWGKRSGKTIKTEFKNIDYIQPSSTSNALESSPSKDKKKDKKKMHAIGLYFEDYLAVRARARTSLKQSKYLLKSVTNVWCGNA